MQRYIFKQKNKIIFLNATLIVVAFISKFIFHHMFIFELGLIFATIIGITPIAIQAYQSLTIKVVSIDVLVTIAVLGAIFIRNYEESAIVTFLFLFGSYLEQRTLNKTRSAIKELTDMAPEVALKQTEEGHFEEVDIFDVDQGDILLVKTGASIPVDGHVTNGSAYVNEASITGEAIPVHKKPDAEVFAGTIVENGTIYIEAIRVGEESTFGKIIELVEEAQDTKSHMERFIDRFSIYYTPAILLLALMIWIFTLNIEMAITALVLGCPGALVIGVPVSNVSGIGNGARHGVLLKGSEVVQDFAKVDVVAFDKTGTLTVGNPKVVSQKFYGDNPGDVLSLLAAVERESDHPLAKAILSSIGDVPHLVVEETEVIKGAGIIAQVQGKRIAVGNVDLIQQENVFLSEEMRDDIKQYEQAGNSLVLTAINNELKLVMGVRDDIRPEVKEAITSMKRLGIKRFIILSGDNEGTVRRVASELGMTEIYGNMLPGEKARFIQSLQDSGQLVAFVGDGINDSPSLAVADIGIAMGSGTDIAIETSDVVLMHANFQHLTHALRLTKSMVRNMKQNIIIALGVVLILIAGLLFSDWVNMSIGMLVHELSIFVVILNGMRLLRFK